MTPTSDIQASTLLLEYRAVLESRAWQADPLQENKAIWIGVRTKLAEIDAVLAAQAPQPQDGFTEIALRAADDITLGDIRARMAVRDRVLQALTEAASPAPLAEKEKP